MKIWTDAAGINFSWGEDELSLARMSGHLGSVIPLAALVLLTQAAIVGSLSPLQYMVPITGAMMSCIIIRLNIWMYATGIL